MTTLILGTLADASLRMTVLAILVAALLRAFRVRSTPMQHHVWVAALVAMLAMPVLPRLVAPTAVAVPLPSELLVWPTGFDLATPSPKPPSSAAPVAETAGAGQPAPAAVRPSSVPWSSIVLWTYVTGVVLFALRLVLGLIGVRRLQRSGRPVALPIGNVEVTISPAVSVPLTAGVFRPRILLPETWTSWTGEQLAAVIAHERAHIARRDPFVLLLAEVNRSLFWFHPAAWWLARQLAFTAEQACDDVAVGAVRHRTTYAEVLIDVAQAVHRRQGRLMWTGIGIDGASRLRARIDRVLQPEADLPFSRTRRFAVTASCAVAIALVVACRQQVAPQPLTPDPSVAARLAKQKADADARKAIVNMSASDVDGLEARLTANPEDLETLKALLTFYGVSGQTVFGWNEMIARTRTHMLWLIAHHPESDLALYGRLIPQRDPDGYARARKLWLAYVAKPDTGVAVLRNAADFLAVADKPEAEAVLVRLKQMDPDGPQPRVRDNLYYAPWSERLGDLYARAIVGSNDDTVFNVVKSVTWPDAHSAYAMSARDKVARSNDAVLVAETGRYLVVNAGQVKLDFDQIALGRTYLVRALQLDPQSRIARTALSSLDARSRTAGLSQTLLSKEAALAGGEIQRKVDAGERLSPEEMAQVQELEDRAVSAMTDEERFEQLPELAVTQYMKAAPLTIAKRDIPGANAAWSRSKEYAEDVLTLAPRFKDRPDYGSSIRSATMTLAANALREGDHKAAVRYLADAANVPVVSTPVTGILERQVIVWLLKDGERESVATYLERVAPSDPASAQDKLEAASSIRAGRMPAMYQFALSQ